MKLILATAAATAALMASTAMAADLIVEEAGVVDVPVSSVDWSGLYIGATVGFGALKADQPYADYYGYWYGSDYYGENDSVSGNGFTAGVTAGGNAQFGNFVLGIEGDINWTNLEATESYDGSYYEISSAWDWYATLRGRAGLAMDGLLVYATAGVAAVNTTYSMCYYAGDCGDYPYDSESTQTQFGVAAGVGAEVMIADNISLKGEVLYIGLPEETIDTPYDIEYSGDYYDANFTNSAVIGRIGLNIHF